MKILLTLRKSINQSINQLSLFIRTFYNSLSGSTSMGSTNVVLYKSCSPKKPFLVTLTFRKPVYESVFLSLSIQSVFSFRVHITGLNNALSIFTPFDPLLDTILFVSCFRRIKIVPFIKCHLYYDKIIILICLIHLYYETNIILQIS